MSFPATRNGSDGRKCHFMRHETASTAGNVISCDTKRLRRSEMPFRATRRRQKDHFWSPEMSKKWFSAISGRPKRPKSGLRPFRVARNDPKEVCGHFGSPEMSKKWFAAISGHQKRLKRGLRPFRVTRNEQKVVFGHFGSPDAASTVVRVMPHNAHDVFRPRRASRSGGACRRTSSRRQRLRPAAFRRIGAGSRPACGAVGGHCRAS